MSVAVDERSLMAGSGPVAIGGVGGSGTRVVAEVLKELGFSIGDDVNDALDNLWFTALFKYREVLALDAAEFSRRYEVFRARMAPTAQPEARQGLRERLLAADRAGQHDRDWLATRYESLIRDGGSVAARAWGWKEPNTHMVIDRIAGLEPQLRYIHVVRNGLDMALSTNQNQLRLWGPLVLGDRFEDTPRGSLAFWCWAHERVAGMGAVFGSRFLLLNFDVLCSDTDAQLQRLLDFLELDVPGETVRKLLARVKAPDSMSRYKTLPLDQFDQDDVRFVRSMGFSVD